MTETDYYGKTIFRDDTLSIYWDKNYNYSEIAASDCPNGCAYDAF